MAYYTKLELINKLDVYTSKWETAETQQADVSWCQARLTLTYKPHLRKVAAKTRTRNNLVHMLAGTRWGAGSKTPSTPDLILCYSAAVYCAPVWRNSAHTNRNENATTCSLCHRNDNATSDTIQIGLDTKTIMMVWTYDAEIREKTHITRSALSTKVTGTRPR